MHDEYAATLADRDRLHSLLECAADLLHDQGRIDCTRLAEEIDQELGINRCPPPREFLERLESALAPAAHAACEVE